MLHHFAKQAAGGAWLVVYRRGHRDELVAVCDCPTQSTAREEARRLNDEAKRRQTATYDDARRRGVRGFYDDGVNQ